MAALPASSVFLSIFLMMTPAEQATTGTIHLFCRG